MKTWNLRTKFIVSALSVIIITIFFSTLGVSYLVRKQNDENSKNLVIKEVKYVRNALQDLQASSVKSIYDFANNQTNIINIRYLLEIKGTKRIDAYKFVLERPKEEMVDVLSDIANEGKIDQVYLYDKYGDLILSLNKENNFLEADYVSFDNKGKQIVKYKKNDVEKKTEHAWQTKIYKRGAANRYNRPLQQKTVARFEVIEGKMALTGVVPFIDVEANPAAREKGSILGCAVFHKFLDQKFVDDLSRKVGMNVNIYVDKSLSFGTYKGLPQLAAARAEDILSVQIISLPQEEYYQAVIPFDDQGNKYLGAIALLLSRQDTINKIRENMVLLLFIMGLTAVIVVPISFFLSDRFLKRIGEMVTKVKEFTGGNLLAKVHTSAHDELGTLGGAFNQMADDLRATIEKLREASEKYRSIYENAMEGIFQTTLQGRFLNVNPACVRIFGYDSSDDMINSVSNIELQIYADAKKRAEFLRLMENTGIVSNFETEFQRKDGEIFNGSLNAHAVRDLQGNILYIEGSIQDITRRKQAEEALHQTNISLMTINMIANAVYNSTDFDTVVARATNAVDRYFGTPSVTMFRLNKEAQCLDQIITSAPGSEAARLAKRLPLKGSFTAQTVNTKEVVVCGNISAEERVSPELRKALGDLGWKACVSLPLLFEDEVLGAMNLFFTETRSFTESEKETFLSIGKTIGLAMANAQHVSQLNAEIIERKRVEEEIKKLNEELEQRVIERTKELESFSYSVSHDLRAPLRSVDGFSRILVEDFSSELSADAKRYAQLVRTNAQQMAKLIADLLQFSRMGRQALAKKEVKPEDIVRQVLGEFESIREGRQIEIIIGDMPVCQADPALLKVVYVNLLSNALKFTGKKEKAIIEIGCNKNEENTYYVKDNGAGFDMKYVDKMFGVFQRLHRQDEFEGTGCGTAIIQRIINRHGGRIWVEAELNKGATFYFTLGKVEN